jgi:hypothetical protein
VELAILPSGGHKDLAAVRFGTGVQFIVFRELGGPGAGNLTFADHLTSLAFIVRLWRRASHPARELSTR